MFVEGKGDVKAVPVLAQRVVDEIGAHDALFVDHEAFRVRGLGTLVKNSCFDLHRLLGAARRTRGNLGAVLLVLDGDVGRVPGTWTRYVTVFRSDHFCAKSVAATLADESRTAGAGRVFSFAVAFAMMEFEAWLLASAESLRGRQLKDGRGAISNNIVCPQIDLENTRDAKGQLKKIIPGYDQSLDQGLLTSGIDLQMVRNRCRSFRRFCSAIKQLTDAIRTENHIVTPQTPLA